MSDKHNLIRSNTCSGNTGNKMSGKSPKSKKLP